MIINRYSTLWRMFLMALIASLFTSQGWGAEPAEQWQEIRRQIAEERVSYLRLQKTLDAASDAGHSPEIRIRLADDLLQQPITNRLRARAWLAKSNGLLQLGQSAASLAAAHEALKFADLADDASLRFGAEYRVGRALANLGRYQEAEDRLLESISLGRALPTLSEELATCYMTLAKVAYQTDHRFAAIEYSREAFQIGQQLHATDICLVTSINLCSMHAERGDLDRAADWLLKAQAVAPAAIDPRMAYALQFCTWSLRIKRGEKFDLAELREALGQATEPIHEKLRASARSIIADAERRQGAWAASIASFRQAIAGLMNYPRPLTESMLGLARALLEKGDLDAAEELLAEIDPDSMNSDRQIEFWELRTALSIRHADSQQATENLRQLEACHRARYARDAAQQAAIQDARLRIADKNRELLALRQAQAAERTKAAEARAEAIQSKTLRNMIALAAVAVMVTAWVVFRGRNSRRLAERLREQQESLNLELQHVVETQTASLRREMESRRQLQNALHHKQRHEAIGKLTGGVAHDFNNLLTAIINANHALRRRMARALDAETLDLLEASEEAAKSGAEIVQGLLAYARQQPLRAATLDLHHYLRSTRSLFRSILGEGMQLTTINKLDPGTSILVDRGQFTTSIINLMTNARDACNRHGQVTVTLDHLRLRPQSDKSWTELSSGSYVRITVRDDGCGMPPEALNRAFEPFFTSKPQESGTGLGLSVVYGFVKQSQGDVRIESSNAGTVVTLLFPRADGQPEAVEPSLPGAEGFGEMVLVVDDNDLVRGATVKLLAASGFEVREARNAAEAMHFIESGRVPDVVLTDVVMPGERDGIGLANWLQQRHPEVRVVLCSGYALESPHADFDVVSKPYNGQELISRLLDSPAVMSAGQ